MKFKKIWAVVLAAVITASVSACGKTDVPENTSTEANTTTAAASTTAAENTTTAAESTTAAATSEKTDISNNNTNTDAESVKVYYGWGQDEADYTATIFCPEGAQFGEYTSEQYAREGLVMSAEVIDEVREYSVISNSYWHPDAYSIDSPILSILQQLYFNGEIDAETAEEYSGCSQKITPLGFKWNGYDVFMLETTYTFKDYGQQTDIFIGVEYDLKYWKVEEGTGHVMDLTTKGLFGFDVFSYNWDGFTKEQWAWIVGQLFGVDTGITDPFAANDDGDTTEPADVDPSALIGTWCDKESSWEDTYFFDNGGYGSYTSGFENTFTYTVEGNTLTVFYAEDDIDIFTVTIDGDALVLVDEFRYEQRFEKVIEEAEDSSESDTEVTESDAEEVNPNITAVIGTWKENTTGIDETFVFNTDGTGHYSCLSGDGIYECGFTYEFFRSDYIDIYFDDGDIGGFLIAIDGDEMTVRNDYVWDLTYTRQ